MERIKDAKKNYVFTLQLKGVPEPLCFGTDEENVLSEWITRLEIASSAKGDYDLEQWQEPGAEDALHHYQSQSSLESVGISESHYNVPRTIIAPEQASQAPAIQVLSANDAINSGIYSAPRSMPAQDSSTFSVQGHSFSLSGDPYAQYDVPRPVSLTPDEEAIYDYPENVIDMEIYDYPPDVLPFLSQDLSSIPTDSNRNSIITLTSEYSTSEQASRAIIDDWSHLPPPPPLSIGSSRPSIALSIASSDFYQSARNSVASMEGVYDHPRSHAVETLTASFLEKSSDLSTSESTDTSTPDTSLEFGVCIMKGHLYKKERFTWNKMYCLIRNSFLECHKPGSTQGPSLKLFLPRSSVTPDKDVKRNWALKVKHPRREGLLQFAAENEEDYHKWMKAFQSAAAIEVQSVTTMDEIRITDLDMKQRMTTLERNTTLLQPPNSNELQIKPTKSGAAVRRNTYSAGDEYLSDTLKRRRKFSWIKGLSKKRGIPHGAASLNQLQGDSSVVSQQDTNVNVLKPTSIDFDIQVPAIPTILPEDRAHHTYTDGFEQFQGYLKVQRKGADDMWVRYWCILEDFTVSCYISRSDLSLTLSIQLKGSRVADAKLECRRDFSFKIWHLESGQCLFFAADDATEYSNWFKEVTKGAEYVVPLDVGVSNSLLSTPFYLFTREEAYTSPSQRSSQSSNASLPDSDNVSIDSETTGSSTTGIFRKGNLQKLSQNKWKDRYCHIKDSSLEVFTTSTEKAPISTIPLVGCRVELVSVPNEEVHLNIFRISTTSGKAHMFSAPSEQEMYTWALAIQNGHEVGNISKAESVEEESSHATMVKGSGKQAKSKVELVSNIPANALLNPLYSGYIEMQLMGTWNRYWGVVHSGFLYVYEKQDSPATVQTIVLSGCEINVRGPQGCKKPCVIEIIHEGISVHIAVADRIELTRWFQAFNKSIQMDTSKPPKLVEQRQEDILNTATLKHSSQCSHATKEVLKTSDGSDPQLLKKKNKDMASGIGDNSHLQQNATVRRYEKKIKKTHRVANLTEQNLKFQQTSLLHFKRELSQLTAKLEEMASKNDEQAKRRLKKVRVKLQQIEKIIPYIGKYIMVNRQAEVQTVAILKESCNVDLQKLKGKGSVPQSSHQKLTDVSINSTELCESSDGISFPQIKLNLPLETHLEEAECCSIPVTEPPTPIALSGESFLHTAQPCVAVKSDFSLQEPASPNVAVPQTENSSQAPNETIAAQSKLSDPPYENLTAARTEAAKYQENLNSNKQNGQILREESPYATLVSVRPAEFNENAKPSRDPPTEYAKLDFTRMTASASPSTPFSPSSLNYVQVDFDPTKQKPVMKENFVRNEVKNSNVESSDMNMDSSNLMDKTLTPESALDSTKQPLLSPIKSELIDECKTKASAMQDAIKLFQTSTPIKGSLNTNKAPPPPVKRKPKVVTPSHAAGSPTAQQSFRASSSVESSPSHIVLRRRSSGVDNIRLCEDNTSPLHIHCSDHTMEAQSITAGTMSVMERIKALQKEKL